MQEESNHPDNNLPEIEFNYDYSVGVVKSLKGKILIGHVEEMYPRVHEKLFLEGSLMPYIEPKIMKQLDLENSYRLQGYPINGLSELARNDVYSMIKDELGPFEEMELANQFDMDINPIIDSQSIQYNYCFLILNSPSNPHCF